MDYQALYQRYEAEGGKLPLSEFTKQVRCGIVLLNYYTFERIDYNDLALRQKAEDCLLELVELYEDNKKLLDNYGQSQGIKSETVGDLKEEYLTASLDEQRKLESGLQKKQLSIIKMYFGLSGLMYRGVIDENKL